MLTGAVDSIGIRQFESEDRDWLVARHGLLYARDEGFDASFERLVGEVVDDFLARHDPTCERGWIAHAGERRLGSIFCVRHDARTAKLRLFLLEPEMRGRGLGRRLLITCMSYAEASGYAGMRLWTHESHRAACGLYRATGWRLESSVPVRSFGRDLVEQSWSYRF